MFRDTHPRMTRPTRLALRSIAEARRALTHRRFHWVTVDLSALKEVKNQLGGTVNDVVLAAVSGDP